MKKLFDSLPLVITGLIVTVLLVLLLSGAFDAPERTTITSSTLTEAVEVQKLSTAKYIQHGIAKVHIEGKEDGYVLYYAVVRATINMQDVEYEVNEDNKVVTAILPEFTLNVERIRDEEHKEYYYPDNSNIWTEKDIMYICEADAIRKAKENDEFLVKARESLENAVEALLHSVLNDSGYELVFA